MIPYFTKRPLKSQKINLIENGANVSNDTELCNILNVFFSNIICELSIPKKYYCFLNDIDSDSVLYILKAFENHPSIKYIKIKKFNSIFPFENTYADVVMKVIKNLNVAKSCRMNNISTKVIKMNCKALWMRRFIACLKYNFFLSKTEHGESKLLTALVLDYICIQCSTRLNFGYTTF